MGGLLGQQRPNPNQDHARRRDWRLLVGSIAPGHVGLRGSFRQVIDFNRSAAKAPPLNLVNRTPRLNIRAPDCGALRCVAYFLLPARVGLRCPGRQHLSGHSFTPSESFTVSATGPLLRLTAPEGDANITVVDLTAVTDADDAVAQAWKLGNPGSSARCASPPRGQAATAGPTRRSSTTRPRQTSNWSCKLSRGATAPATARPGSYCCCRPPKPRWKSAAHRSANSSPRCGRKATRARASPASPPSP